LSAAEQTVTTKALESLEKRITQHCVSAKYIANFLLANRRVSAVHHLGLKSHPQFSYASESLRDFGGVLSLVLSGGIDAAMTFQEKLNLFSVSEIFGGSKSTMWHPASKTYSSVPSEIRSHLGAADGFFQFSIGLENVDDLTADLEQALAI
jgi:cystathionine beta-lyase